MDGKKKKLLEDYISTCINKGYQYEEDAISGKIIVPKTIKQAALRQRKLREKYIVKEDKLQEFYKFIFFINITHKSKVIRFVPSGWQCFFFNCIYGLYKQVEKFEEDQVDLDVLRFQDNYTESTIDIEEDEERLFQHVLLFVARKSGKSITAGIAALYELTKGNKDAEIFLFGREKSQALHLLDYLKSIVSESPALSKRIDQLSYKLRFGGNGNCYCKPMSYDSTKKDGYLPSACIYDEYAVYEDRSTVEIMTSGQGATKNPIHFYVSSANFFLDHPLNEDIEIGKKVLAGEVDNDRWLYCIYQMDEEDLEGDNFKNTKNWVKANPNIGASTSLASLVAMWETSQLTVSGRRNFQCKNLNMILSDIDGWLDDESIKKCSKDFDVTKLFGKEAYIGMDLSQTTDLSSLTLTVVDDDDQLYQIFKTYFPNKQGDKRLRKNKLDISGWIDDGHIIPIDSKYIDNDIVYQQIIEWLNNFDVKSILFDPYSAKDIIEKLESDVDIWSKTDILPFPQQTRYFNFPIRTFEKYVEKGEITFEKNPCFRYNVSNVVPYYDYNLYMKLDKKTSKESIDMCVSAVMSFAGYINNKYGLLKELDNKNKEE